MKDGRRGQRRARGRNQGVAAGAFCAVAAALLVSGCGGRGGSDSAGKAGATVTIQSKGSDTMVNVAQSWAEEYKRVRPDVDVEVSGGGSGVGISALTRGMIDVANASRNMKAEEIELAKRDTGKEPKEFIVGYDAVAVYVNKDNPLDEITIEQLAQIFVEGGTITKWSELGASIPGAGDDIVRVSRQSSSGTYEFFREHVLAKHDFKLGSRDMNGSKEVVELVGSTPTAIGYSGMGYNEPEKVKMLKIASRPDTPAVAPTMQNALSHAYPIARSLQIYTLGEPVGEVKQYVDWCMSDAGQAIVEACGYVPLPSQERAGKP